jgi:protein kinase
MRAEHKSTREVVAVKKMKRKFYSWDECMALREVKSLRKLSHPNIIKLKEVIRENDELHLVFEFMETNLYSLIKDRAKGLPEKTVRNVLYQMLQGLGFMHRQGYFHRDIKPENLLVTGNVVKLADFGLVREIRARPPFTDYVSTRWYRAPEVILRLLNYSSPVDIWAAGALMTELYTLRPIFPGSSETDQMYKICSVLGTPTMDTWPEGLKQAQAISFRLAQFVSTPMDVLVPQASHAGHEVISRMLAWSPLNRLDCFSALGMNYFQAHLDDIAPGYLNPVGGKSQSGQQMKAPAAPAAEEKRPSWRDPVEKQPSLAAAPSYPGAKLGEGLDRPRPSPANGSVLPSITGAPGPMQPLFPGNPASRAGSNGSSGHGSRASSRSRYANAHGFKSKYQEAARYPGHPPHASGVPGAAAYLAQQAAPRGNNGGFMPLGATHHGGAGPMQQNLASLAPSAGSAPAAMGPSGMRNIGGLSGLGALGAPRDKSSFASAGRSVFNM